MTAAARSCGECQLCCELLAVRERGHRETTGEAYEFDKPAQTRCAHQCASGCALHDRPELPISCRVFECEWLQGHFREADRPDRSGLVVSFRKGPGRDQLLACIYGAAVTTDRGIEVESRARRTLSELMDGRSGVDLIEFYPRGEGLGPDRVWALKRRPGLGWEPAVVVFGELDWTDADKERAILREMVGPGPVPHRLRDRIMDYVARGNRARERA